MDRSTYRRTLYISGYYYIYRDLLWALGRDILESRL
jgi:hypothetical protein